MVDQDVAPTKILVDLAYFGMKYLFNQSHAYSENGLTNYSKYQSIKITQRECDRFFVLYENQKVDACTGQTIDTGINIMSTYSAKNILSCNSKSKFDLIEEAKKTR